MPNFAVIGAAKSGTTAFYEYLKQHPDIYMSHIKEPRFFALEEKGARFCGPGDAEINSMSVTDLEAYRDLFNGVKHEKAIGEASNINLQDPGAPHRIRHYIPNAKLIAILRNPVEQVYSSFLRLVRDGHEPLTDFAEALKEEKSRIENNWSQTWHYKARAFYYAQLKRYFDLFDRKQLKIYLYEDFCRDPVGVMQETYRFLEVDDTFVPETSLKYNTSGFPRSRRLNAYLTKPDPFKQFLERIIPEPLRRYIRINLINRNLVKPPLSPELRKQLTEDFREDILKLQDLIQRDLSGWLAYAG